jgi:hypothetical protein
MIKIDEKLPVRNVLTFYSDPNTLHNICSSQTNKKCDCSLMGYDSVYMVNNFSKTNLHEILSWETLILILQTTTFLAPFNSNNNNNNNRKTADISQTKLKL